jgi:hypothetical protein
MEEAREAMTRGYIDPLPSASMVCIASFSLTAHLCGYLKRSKTTTDLAATL